MKKFININYFLRKYFKLVTVFSLFLLQSFSARSQGFDAASQITNSVNQQIIRQQTEAAAAAAATAAAQTASQSTATKNSSSIQQAPPPVLAGGSTNIQKSADNAQKTNDSMIGFGMMGVAKGIAYIVTGESCCSPYCPALCWMIPIGQAAVSKGQAIIGDGGVKKEGARQTGLQVTDPGQKHSYTDEFVDQYPDASIRNQYKNALAQAEKMGYKIGRDGTVTSPKGVVTTPDSPEDPAAMAALRADKGKMLALATKDLDAKGGPGLLSAGDLSGPKGEEGGNGNGKFKWPKFVMGAAAASKSKRNPATGGLKKLYNGTPIGLAEDNLFTMVKNRCTAIDTQGGFRLDGIGMLFAPGRQK